MNRQRAPGFLVYGILMFGIEQDKPYAKTLKARRRRRVFLRASSVLA
jgi:hypothetical protein